MIDLYIFDQGGVVTQNFDILPELARRLGLEADEVRGIALADLEPYMRGEIGADEFWDRFSERSGRLIEEDYWVTLFRPRLDEAVYALAAGLGRSARVVGGTNTIDSHYEVLRRLGHYGCFSKVYASHHLGLAKPDEAFWNHILSAEGVPPERTFFADDTPENIEAAHGLGIHARLFRSYEGLVRELRELGAPLDGGD